MVIKDFFNNRLNRIQTMEQYLDEILQYYGNDPLSIYANADLKNKLHFLMDYYDGGLWLQDYQADERGELPPDLKRGVLAEDTLYNLFYDLNHIDEIESSGE